MADSRPSIFILGAGAAGVALGRALRRAGYSVRGAYRRGARDAARAARRIGTRAFSGELPGDLAQADLVLVCVRDDAIGGIARTLAGRPGIRRAIVLHVSGVRGAQGLFALRARARGVGAMHPLQTFARDRASLRGVAFAIDGDAVARRAATRMARDLGGFAVRVRDRGRAPYHAAASILANGLVALFESAATLLGRAGLPAERRLRMLLPLARQVLANVGDAGPAGALTGPVARGDGATVARHLAALARSPREKRLYLALGAVLVDLARKKRSARPSDLRAVERLLARGGPRRGPG